MPVARSLQHGHSRSEIGLHPALHQTALGVGAQRSCLAYSLRAEAHLQSKRIKSAGLFPRRPPPLACPETSMLHSTSLIATIVVGLVLASAAASWPAGCVCRHWSVTCWPA